MIAMRNRLMIGTAALLLASATVALAQSKPQEQTSTPSSGSVDIGGRFTSTSGDEARYERYRDLRGGVNANVIFKKDTENWAFDVSGSNIGYRDQRYAMGFNSKRVKFSLLFDSIPLNYSYDSRTPYVCGSGNCTLDPALRASIQTSRGTGATPVNSNTIVGVPQTLAQVQTGTLYNSIAKTFDMQSRRDTIAASLRFSATDNLDLLLGVKSYSRSGNQPYGLGFAFNNLVEIPMVIDNRETEVATGIEWASHQGMFRVMYEHSKFSQNVPTLSVDNPLHATNWSSTPGTGWDPSGYTNAHGAAMSRMAMAPSNSVDTVNWLGMVKLPGHTTANASFIMGANRQNDALIPWTTNAVVANANTYATFPELASLPRDSADMYVNYITSVMNVNSRPHKYLTLSARYRYNSRNDFTRPFEAVEYVRMDAVPEETGGEAEPFNINRNTFDLNAALTPLKYGTIRFGYGYDRYEHGVRATEGWKDDTFRVSFDTASLGFMTLRAQYENTAREAVDLDIAEIQAGGGQPALRFYDEASRNRDRFSLMAEFNPISSVGVNLTVATGKDDYAGADSSQQFGLLNNKNNAFTVGVDYAPEAKVNLGLNYGYETYNAVQQSRNANPAPDVSWTDPNRNWTMTNDEHVNTLTAYVNLVKLISKTDMRLAYDYSTSDQAFVHGGPRIPALAATAPGQFIALPNVTDSWSQLSFDLTYALSKKMAVGFSLLREDFDVSDYATINTGGSQTLPDSRVGAQSDKARLDWWGSLLTGYGNRPYTGTTGVVRVFYFF
jgi:MtrB/PioB family decaheme-associated outer membrane protein